MSYLMDYHIAGSWQQPNSEGTMLPSEPNKYEGISKQTLADTSKRLESKNPEELLDKATKEALEKTNIKSDTFEASKGKAKPAAEAAEAAEAEAKEAAKGLIAFVKGHKVLSGIAAAAALIGGAVGVKTVVDAKKAENADGKVFAHQA